MLRFGRASMLVGGVSVLAAATGLASCKGEILPPQGEIVIIVETDVALPDSIDKIQIEISSNGVQKFSNQYDVGLGKLSIPATLGVLQGPDPKTPLLFRLIGRKSGTAKTLREVLTTIPSDRVVALRMPIRWMCDDTATERLPITNPPSADTKRCPNGQTCVGGDCYGPQIDSSLLPDYTEGDRGKGPCFDVVACMSSGVPVQMDTATCTFAKPLDTSKLNVALKVKNDGICDATKTSCFVILDRLTTTTGPLDGWRESGDKIQLTPEVCKRLTATPPRIDAVIASTGCPSKPVNLPVCGLWNTTPTGPGPTNPGDGGVDAPPTTPPGVVVSILDLDGERIRRGDEISGVRCDPWFEGTRLYFCSSGVPPAAPTVDLSSIDVANPNTLSTRIKNTIPPTNDFLGPFHTQDKIFVLGVTASFEPLQLYRVTPSVGPNPIGAPFGRADDFDFFYPHMAMDATRLYLARSHSSLNPGIAAIDNSTANVSTIAQSLLVNQPTKALVIDDSPSGFIYVLTEPGSSSTDFARIEKIAKTASNGTTTLVADLPVKTVRPGLILDGSDLYVLSHTTGSIYRVPAAGGAPVQVYTGLNDPDKLALRSESLYWLEEGPTGTQDRARRAPKAGGQTPVDIAVEPQPSGGFSNFDTLTLDQTYVYLGNNRDQPSRVGSIKRVLR